MDLADSSFSLKMDVSYSTAPAHEWLWFDNFLEYMSTDYSWTFWCLNPNSQDTGGILQDDWVSVEQWKLDALEPYLAPLIE